MFRRIKWFVAVLLVLGFCTDAVLGELIGYWSFDEGQGTATSDVTGNGNDGTLSSGVDWVPGYKDSGVRFDTAGERVVVGPIDPTAENNAMTLAAWINWEGEGHTIGQQGIIGKRQGWDPGTGIKWFWQAQPSGALLFRADWANGGGTGLWWNNTYLLPYANEWAHVALTWDDGAAIQYINGEEVSTGNVTFQDTADATPVAIGCVSATNNESFVGIIDEARIYNRALTQTEIQTAMLGEVTTANRPSPPDGAFHEDTWVNLSWQPGDFTVSHDVYLGESLDDVNNATSDSDVFRGNQLAMFYMAGFPGFAYPEGLVPGTTYYWRIDEVNDANPDSPWKGDAWSFTVPPKIAYEPVPADGAEAVALDARLGWTPGFGAKLHTLYFGEDFDTVSNATGGAPLGNATHDPGPLKAAKTYYWRVDEFDPPATHKGDVWSFTTEGTAINPNPAKGAVGVGSTPILSWSPGNLAASHDVYFGEDAEAVENATKASPEHQGTRALGDESYDTGKLTLETTYYWRIDEVNSVNPDSPWIGNVWSFTTGNSFLLEDFEDYTDDDAAGLAIWQNWIDGFGVATNGSQVGYVLPPYAEQTIVHGGSQSMPLSYDNRAGVTNSEATLTLTANRDWTAEGVGELSIWFQGLRGSVGSFVEDPAGTLTMTASGTDIWDVGTAGDYRDEFHFAYKTLTGPGTIVARVESIENTHDWAKAGVMIRETLEPGSMHAFACVTPANGVASQGRIDTGGASFNTAEGGITAPHWVKLERSISGMFTVSHSADGSSWAAVAGTNPTNIQMASTVYIGLAVTSHDAGLTAQAVFSNVTTTGNVTGQWTNEDIGILSNATEPLYAAISNATGTSAVIAHDDPDAATIDTWTEWVIDLQRFADQGIDLTNVDKIAIGLGSNSGAAPSGGSGVLYFDDLRLYRQRNAGQ